MARPWHVGYPKLFKIMGMEAWTSRAVVGKGLKMTQDDMNLYLYQYANVSRYPGLVL